MPRPRAVLHGAEGDVELVGHVTLAGREGGCEDRLGDERRRSGTLTPVERRLSSLASLLEEVVR
jgi:hypothetical protein